MRSSHRPIPRGTDGRRSYPSAANGRIPKSWIRAQRLVGLAVQFQAYPGIKLKEKPTARRQRDVRANNLPRTAEGAEYLQGVVAEARCSTYGTWIGQRT